MKKLVLEGPRKSKLIDVDEPKIGENELLVKIKYTGVCSSEMPPWAEGDMKQNFGHEPMGIVVDKGSAVKDFKIGDRVTGLGPGYQEYGVMLPENTCKIPDNVADEDAAAEPYGCLLSAVGKVPVKIPGDTVVVVGAGYMGLGAISLYKLFGAGRIIVVDPREEARANALKYGATEVYAPMRCRPIIRSTGIIGASAIYSKPGLTRCWNFRALKALCSLQARWSALTERSA